MLTFFLLLITMDQTVTVRLEPDVFSHEKQLAGKTLEEQFENIKILYKRFNDLKPQPPKSMAGLLLTNPDDTEFVFRPTRDFGAIAARIKYASKGVISRCFELSEERSLTDEEMVILNKVLLVLGEVFYNSFNRPDAASLFTDLSVYFQGTPTEIYCRHILAKLEVMNSNWDSAFEQYHSIIDNPSFNTALKAVEIYQHLDVLMDFAQVLYLHKRYAEAKAIYELLFDSILLHGISLNEYNTAYEEYVQLVAMFSALNESGEVECELGDVLFGFERFKNEILPKMLVLPKDHDAEHADQIRENEEHLINQTRVCFMQRSDELPYLRKLGGIEY
ncbi:MAG: hypothetical protein CR997_11570 [Acidobacteria bacterium]|nr:MAG: hypothetical protein CR997_11570 [Acidobacteriota bacterium]